VHAPAERRAVADVDWIGAEGRVAPGDELIVRSGELLRGNENVQGVGMFEEDP
jgi:hypothetical protein